MKNQSYWLSRGRQVLHQRWISGILHYVRLGQVQIRLPTLALKSREDVTQEVQNKDISGPIKGYVSLQPIHRTDSRKNSSTKLPCHNGIAQECLVEFCNAILIASVKGYWSIEFVSTIAHCFLIPIVFWFQEWKIEVTANNRVKHFPFYWCSIVRRKLFLWISKKIQTASIWKRVSISFMKPLDSTLFTQQNIIYLIFPGGVAISISKVQCWLTKFNTDCRVYCVLNGGHYDYKSQVLVD